MTFLVPMSRRQAFIWRLHLHLNVSSNDFKGHFESYSLEYATNDGNETLLPRNDRYDDRLASEQDLDPFCRYNLYYTLVAHSQPNSTKLLNSTLS
jgi:hypothetical protein